MKKLLLPVVLLSALALSGATVPAVAESPATVSATVEAVQPVTADSGVILTVDTVEVTTEPAPVATEPTAPATTEPVATASVVVPAPAETVSPVTVVPTQGTVTPETWNTSGVPLSTWKDVQGTAPVPATAPADSYVAPAPSYTCMEDQPCWDCHTMGNGICGNPACTAANKFTVTKDGQCATAPLGYTDSDVMSEGHRMEVELKRGWVMGGANSQITRREGFTYIESPTLPGVLHIFVGGADTVAPGSTGATTDCNIVSPLEGGQGAWAGSGTACKK